MPLDGLMSGTGVTLTSVCYFCDMRIAWAAEAPRHADQIADSAPPDWKWFRTDYPFLCCPGCIGLGEDDYKRWVHSSE